MFKNSEKPTKLSDEVGGFYPVSDFIDLVGKNQLLDNENRTLKTDIENLSSELDDEKAKYNKLFQFNILALVTVFNIISSVVISVTMMKKK